MEAELSWIEAPWQGKLAIVPRPRGGDWLEDKIREWRLAGVGAVASLLTVDETAGLGLSEEARLCQESGIQYLSFPIVDRGVPVSRTAAPEFARKLEALLASGKTVAIHFRQGIGRSALMAACVLALSGVTPDAAFQRLSAARDCSVPETAEQRAWVMDFARELAPRDEHVNSS